MNCPNDGSPLEFISGDYGTGVYAPDGVQERRYQEGWSCWLCGRVFEEDEMDEGCETNCAAGWLPLSEGEALACHVCNDASWTNADLEGDQ